MSIREKETPQTRENSYAARQMQEQFWSTAQGSLEARWPCRVTSG